MDDLGEVTKFDYIRAPYSAPKIIIEFELETSAGVPSIDPSYHPEDGNFINPWELP